MTKHVFSTVALLSGLITSTAVAQEGIYYAPSSYNYDPICYCQGPVQITHAFAYTGAHNLGRQYAASGNAYASLTNIEGPAYPSYAYQAPRFWRRGY